MDRNPVDSQSPPRNIVPGLIPVERVLSRTDSAVLWVPVIRVFPGGVICDIELVHTNVPEQDRQQSILQDYTIQLSVDSSDTHFTLGRRLAHITEPFPVVFWKRSSSAYGIVSAAWIGRIPDLGLSIKSITGSAEAQRLQVSRDEIDSAASKIIRVGDIEDTDDVPGIAFLG